jgi:hypothetical protein
MVHGDGVQSGPSEGPFYSGGMIYDRSGDMLYMTGLHYNNRLENDLMQLKGTDVDSDASNCFVATIDLGFDQGEFQTFDDWNNFGSPGVLETCNSLVVHNPDQLVVIGSAGPGGDILPRADGSIPLNGMAMIVDKNVLSLLEGFPLDTLADPTNRLLYPVSSVTDGRDNIYVVALTSTDAEPNPAVNANKQYPNWQEEQKYGSSLDMTVFKVKISQATEEVDGIPTGATVIKEVWTKEFPVDATSTPPPRVYIGGVVYKQNTSSGQEYLIVAGSTRGLGEAYGNAEGNDEDGFVTVLDPATGELHAGTKNNIREGTAEDDIVTGICDDPTDEEAFFVVGATRGGDMGTQQTTDSALLGQLPAGSLQPFVRKVRVSDLSDQWTNQWAALPPTNSGGSIPGLAYAMGCTVDGSNLYVTGTVKDGSSIVQGDSRQQSQGGDDVWIARMDKSSGVVDWMTQLGSSGDDKVARYGSVVTNSQANPIIFGDTSGSLYRQRAAGSSDTEPDMFVLSLDSGTGSVQDSDFMGGISGTSAASVSTQAPNNGDGDADPSPAVPAAAGDAPTYAPAPLPVEGHQYIAVGLQITDPGHAGGIVYNDATNSVLLTGAIFVDSSGDSVDTSMCFTGQVNLDNGNLESKFSEGSASNQEACSAVSFDHAHSLAFAIGGMNVGNGNGFDQASSSWSSTSGMMQAGIILQANDSMLMVGGNNIVGHSVVYPIAVANDPHTSAVYVASMVSDDGSAATNAGDDDQYPNYTSGGRRDFGSKFSVFVQQYSFDPSSDTPTDPLPSTLSLDWENIFETTSGSVTVSGMTLAGNGNTLVVVGSTSGSGGAFEENDGEDMDGFILKVDPSTGELVQGSSGQERGSTRLDSINKKDDYILQVCNDRFDHDAFYVVGTSGGKVRNVPDDQQAPEGSMHAFVAKINVQGLNAVWLKHYTMSIPDGGQVFGEALACTVTPDTYGKNVVYVGGTIRDGALADGVDISQSNGGDDIFVASMDGASGDVNWIRQVGTAQNDRLAHGRGLDVDAFGNAIVFGETEGNMYGENTGGSNMVLFTMNKLDGSYLIPQMNGAGVGVDTSSEISPSDQIAPAFPDSIAAIQSGPDVGPSYSGGVVYDAFSNSLYVTGATYGTFSSSGVSASSSNCFLGVVSLPGLQWKERSVFGTDSSPEACSAISLANYKGKSEVMMVGTTEAGGLLSGLSANTGGVDQFGVILDVSNQGGSYELLGGAVLDNSAVQFPIQVVAIDDKVFVAAMASNDQSIRSDFEKSKPEYPNFTTGGIQKYGSEYRIVVERHTINRGRDGGSGVLETTMSLDWRKPFETADKRSVFVSGMAVVDAGEALVIVGSTREDGDDFDGIMAKVNVDDGAFESESENARSVAYFSSVSGQDDWIHGVCTDPDDPSVFYIVGATEGDVGGSDSNENVDAVIAKIKTDTLEIMWSKQIYVSPAPTGAKATAMTLGCDVIRGAGYMYFAGNVEKGAVIENDDDPQQSFGNDDIFVGMLETRSGDLIWLKQVGSYGDDRVARGSGVCADQNGNAVVYGDTTGDLYRIRDGDSDPSYSNIFLVVFNQADGTHVPPFSTGWVDSARSIFSDPKYLAFAITVLIMLALSIFCFCYARHTQRKRAEAQKSSIFAYLQAFDVEDIDLRKSPPGGWHGTYLNKLAYGINKADTSGRVTEALETAPSLASNRTFEMSPLTTTHSSIVKDSLFMDTMSTPSLGNQEYYDDLTPREERKNIRGGSMVDEPKIV